MCLFRRNDGQKMCAGSHAVKTSVLKRGMISVSVCGCQDEEKDGESMERQTSFSPVYDKFG